jgi:hypothetical protein
MKRWGCAFVALSFGLLVVLGVGLWLAADPWLTEKTRAELERRGIDCVGLGVHVVGWGARIEPTSCTVRSGAFERLELLEPADIELSWSASIAAVRAGAVRVTMRGGDTDVPELGAQMLMRFARLPTLVGSVASTARELARSQERPCFRVRQVEVRSGGAAQLSALGIELAGSPEVSGTIESIGLEAAPVGLGEALDASIVGLSFGAEGEVLRIRGTLRGTASVPIFGHLGSIETPLSLRIDDYAGQARWSVEPVSAP